MHSGSQRVLRELPASRRRVQCSGLACRLELGPVTFRDARGKQLTGLPEGLGTCSPGWSFSLEKGNAVKMGH